MSSWKTEHNGSDWVTAILGGADLTGESLGFVAVGCETECFAKRGGDGRPVGNQGRDIFGGQWQRRSVRSVFADDPHKPIRPVRHDIEPPRRQGKNQPSCTTPPIQPTSSRPWLIRASPKTCSASLLSTRSLVDDPILQNRYKNHRHFTK